MGSKKNEIKERAVGKINKVTLSVTCFVIVLVIGIVMGIFICSKVMAGADKKDDTVYDTNIIANQINELSELTTLEYKYKNAAKAEQAPQRILGKIDIPFTGNSMIVCYEGTVKIGTDLSKAVIKVDGKSIDLELEPCQILSHEIDENSWEYLDTSSSVFNPLTPQDGDELRKSQKEIIEKGIVDEGLLDEADKKAIEQIKSFLKTIYPDASVTIVVK